MSDLINGKKSKLCYIHPLLFGIIPIIFIFSENIHLLPITELILPIGISFLIIIPLLIIFYKLPRNANSLALILSLLLILFFSYGHIYNLISDSFLSDSEISRHRYLLIPFFISGILGSIYFLKSNRIFNNATIITNVIAISVTIIIFTNISMDVADGNIFGNPELLNNERFFGVGASNSLIFENENFVNNKQNASKIFQTNPPDIYYIILDEYPSNKILKTFFEFDNNNFTSFLQKNQFHTSENSFSNYPTTIQSLTSSLNMQYLDKLTQSENKNSKNFKLLNQLLSENLVMKKLNEQGYSIYNIGSLWGPNGEFKLSNQNFCEFKEVNRDSLIKELFHTSIVSYFYEKYFEQLRRDSINCTFDTIVELSQINENPKFVFAHILLPHAPYIFGPNGENVDSGNIIKSNEIYDLRNAHVNQIKFANNVMMNIIPKLVTSEHDTIVILQSDTGTGFKINWNQPTDNMVIERLGNLNYIHFPNKNYEKFDDVSPVNTFRIIFNEYFDENFPILEDKMYWSSAEHPYNYKDVTQIIHNDIKQ
tara:strand:- start:244 stop:1860 length:1617 start_codon:yes stop_codon:yes gene_type:complete